MTGKTKIIIAVSGILIAGGIGAYFLLRPDKEQREQKKKDKADKQGSNGGDLIGDNYLNEAPTDGCGRVVVNHDASWDYKKCSGIWFTTRKGKSNWVSLANNKEASDKLDAFVS